MSTFKTEKENGQTEDKEKVGWYHKDLTLDSLPGISLEKAYNELITEGGGEEVIVALIDAPVLISHSDLKKQIYVNRKEIPNNTIDDDGNGYIDDINGWNFLGHGSGKTIRFANYDYLRTIRRFEKKFENLKLADVPAKEHADYQKYRKAVELSKAELSDIEAEIAYRMEEKANFEESIKLFPEAYNSETGLFDSKITDTITAKTERQKEMLEVLKDNAYYGFYPEFFDSKLEGAQERGKKSANPDFNERDSIGDDIYDLDDIKGNNNVNAPEGLITHGTQVAGVIAATRNNKIGLKGISNKIKIMPLVVLPERGTELDKDIANAIRYAVDNGAKVINYSHGKYFADKEDYLLDAIKYADKNGVLIIAAAGNTAVDTDNADDYAYPKDNPDNGDEVVDNLIKVGATGKNLNFIKPTWSSYGKRNVDLFAPGQRIYTTNSGPQEYFELGGSSLSAALTSGVAALLYSQYTNLTFRQVKQILLTSGTPFDQELELDDNDSVTVNFKQLSKSGKILNAYNALEMAKDYSLSEN